MDSSHGHSETDKSSTRKPWAPLHVQSFEQYKTPLKNAAQANEKECNAKPAIKSPVHGAIYASKFLSAFSEIWDFIGDPAVLQHDARLKCNETYRKKSSQQIKHKLASEKSQSFCDELKSICFASSAARSNFDDLERIKKQLFFASCNGDSCTWKNFWSTGSHAHEGNGNTAWSMTSPGETNPQARINENPSLIDPKQISDSSILESVRTSFEDSASQDKANYVTHGWSNDIYDNLAVEKGMKLPGYVYQISSLTQLTSRKDAVFRFRSCRSYLNLSHKFACTSDHCLRPVTVISSPSAAEVLEEHSTTKVHNVHDDKGSFQELISEQQHSPNNRLTEQGKVRKLFAMNGHAVAGGFAGIMVSLCLHPIDTIKTIVQADCMRQKSMHCTLRRIITDKGISGLYRGIPIKIASSAPISAIYTFTYESVKGVLLPILPKEYHSFAHCFAGGCSSIATSFVFTPCERIKQQMQVGLHYHNSWNTVIGCLGKGGLPSLYAGWTAVLCRNVPHSIIKFYTYEKLKQLLVKPEGGFGTLETLLCGGIAGSTAAFFTTPFDVVKTKLQTQIPGSTKKYNGVLHAFQEIARHEGAQGLYRGLTPRLVMYVSQGAIFFASYEFLKAVFAVNVAHNK